MAKSKPESPKPTYRPVPPEQLKMLGLLANATPPSRPDDRYEKFLDENFPPEAVAICVSFAPQYDDVYYEYRVAIVTAVSASGEEVLPLKNRFKVAQKAAIEFYFEKPKTQDEDQSDGVYLVRPFEMPRLFVLE